MKSTNYGAHYTIFYSLVTLSLLVQNLLLSILFSNTLNPVP
jgi:hypothetical protein